MFLKLCKMELKYSYRGFLFAYCLLLVSSLFIRINGSSDSFFQSILAIIYTGTIIALFIMIFISIFRNYSKSMFSKESYLTHTLPVSTSMLLNSKVLVSAIWCLSSMMVIILSVFIFILMAGQVSLSDLKELFGYLFTNLSWDNTQVLIWGIVYSIVDFFEFILVVFFILNLIHTRLVPKGKAVVGVIIYFFIYTVAGFVVNDIICQIFALDTVKSLVTIEIVTSVVLGTLYYFGSVYLLEHKLEIE